MKTKLMRMIQVLRIIRKIQIQHQKKNPSALINATRLWNAIDYMIDPEVYWGFMQGGIPWAFRDYRDANSMRFAYRRFSRRDFERMIGNIDWAIIEHYHNQRFLAGGEA